MSLQQLYSESDELSAELFEAVGEINTLFASGGTARALCKLHGCRTFAGGMSLYRE